ncbi:MAG: MotA/TolQ/ExbB proton channel family protein [Myxococcota bacterium]
MRRWLTRLPPLLFVVVLGLVAVAEAAPPADWAAAEAAELRALRAERDALAESLRKTKANTTTTRTSLRGEVDTLSKQLTRLQVRNAELERDLPERERIRGEQAEQALLRDLMGRMRNRLAPERVEALGAGPQSLPGLVAAVFEEVRAQSTLRIEHDVEFFVDGGTAQRGTVARVGQVAALQWSPIGRALVATPEGFRQAVGLPVVAEERDEAVVAKAVLYDPDDPPAPGRYRADGWRADMDAGGPIMWVLLALGVVASVIALERIIGLLLASRRWRFEQRRFEAAVRDKTTSELLEVDTWIAKPLVIAAAARCPSCSSALDTDVQERATQALMVMRERLQRRLSLVNVVAGVAPLLGLLGTVTGMIHTFAVVTTTGTGEPQQLAAGISQALLTTQFGLVIAIPAFLAYALLSRGARRILASAEQAVLWYLHGAGVLIEPTGEHRHSGLHSVLTVSGTHVAAEPDEVEESHG